MILKLEVKSNNILKLEVKSNNLFEINELYKFSATCVHRVDKTVGAIPCGCPCYHHLKYRKQMLRKQVILLN